MGNDIEDSLGTDISLMGTEGCDDLEDIPDDLELALKNALDIDELSLIFTASDKEIYTMHI